MFFQLLKLFESDCCVLGLGLGHLPICSFTQYSRTASSFKPHPLLRLLRYKQYLRNASEFLVLFDLPGSINFFLNYLV